MVSATNDERNQSRDTTGYLLLYMFIGPLIGTLALFLGAMFSAGGFSPGNWHHWRLPELGALGMVIIGFFLPGWFFGFIPALVCAYSLIALRRHIRSETLWLATAPFVGWFTVFVPLALIFGVKSFENLPVTSVFALIGSVAATGCQTLAWCRHIYPARLR